MLLNGTEWVIAKFNLKTLLQTIAGVIIGQSMIVSLGWDVEKSDAS